MTRTRLYWTCQLVGWALAMGAWLVLAALTGGIIGPRPSALQVVYALAVGYGMSVGATHGIHVVAQRRGWGELPLRSLVPRLLLASLAAAVVAQVAGYALGLVTEPFTNPEAVAPRPLPSPLEFVGGALMTTAMFTVWSTVYALALVAFRLADAERERLTLRASLAESRMRALEYQLNPHALFNTLNTVRALIREDPDEARRAVTLLAGLLRQTLAAGREATHPLADDLALARTTLDIEAIRFEDRLHTRFDVADDALAVPVPTLLLQTLVENAVKHGVARRKGGGEVAVSAEVAGGRLVLRVENPSPEPGAAPLPDGTGTGLANARERLALLFGDDATLDLAVGPERTVASVVLPVSQPEPTDA